MAKNKTRKMPPIHPGKTLREDFMKPPGLTANRLAIGLRVPAARNHRRYRPPSGTVLRNEPAVLD
jgi:hypothetical protein